MPDSVRRPLTEGERALIITVPELGMSLLGFRTARRRFKNTIAFETMVTSTAAARDIFSKSMAFPSY